jgi:hypothetical protein
MLDIDEIAHKISEYRYRIKQLEQEIEELLCSPVVDFEGNIISYADL